METEGRNIPEKVLYLRRPISNYTNSASAFLRDVFHRNVMDVHGWPHEYNLCICTIIKQFVVKIENVPSREFTAETVKARIKATEQLSVSSQQQTQA